MPSPILPGRDRRARGPRWLHAALWLVFTALMVAAYDLVLRACGTWPVLGYARNYCPAPPDRSFAREIAEGRRLRGEVHAAEMALAEEPPCPANAGPPSPVIAPPPKPAPPAPPPKPTPAVEPAVPDTREMDRRVNRDRGKTGELQITLAWNTLDDLDLNVTCPDGRITSLDGAQGSRGCGDGVKDIDANRNLVENVSSTPVENIVWKHSIPDGEYVIEVIEYRAGVREGQGNTVPFTLRLRLGEDERTCRGRVGQIPFAEREIVDGQVKTGFAQTLRWHTGQPLPDCEFTEIATIRRASPK